MQYRYANANDSRKSASHTPDTRQFGRRPARANPADCSTTSPTPSRTSCSTTTRPSRPPSQPTADHKYQGHAHCEVPQAASGRQRQRNADAASRLIDIGVFNGKKDEEKPLYLKKEWLTQPTQTFEIIVDQMPTRAGIDPYNKLIDRDSDDNWMDVTKR